MSSYREDELDDLAISLVGYGWSAYLDKNPRQFTDAIKARVGALVAQKQKEARIDEDGELLKEFTKHCDDNNVKDSRVFAELVSFISRRQVVTLQSTPEQEQQDDPQ